MRLTFGLAIITLSILCPKMTPDAWSASSLLCTRNVEITPVRATETKASDPCTGSVILQGISYACVPEKEVARRVKKFLPELSRQASAYCSRFCQERSTPQIQCTGSFISPSKCGWTIPQKSAARFGKTMEPPCGENCEGTAFAYCSIYHASYLKTVPEHFENQPPNCFCKRLN